MLQSQLKIIVGAFENINAQKSALSSFLAAYFNISRHTFHSLHSNHFDTVIRIKKDLPSHQYHFPASLFVLPNHHRLRFYQYIPVSPLKSYSWLRSERDACYVVQRIMKQQNGFLLEGHPVTGCFDVVLLQDCNRLCDYLGV